MALTAISLAVAAIPEALPAVVTVLLAIGRAPHGAPERTGAPPAFGGDAGLGDGDLFRQDRHADAEPHAGARPRTASAPLSANTRCGGRRCCATTPRSTVTAAGQAIRPRPRWPWPARPPACRRPSWRAIPRVHEWPFDSERKRMSTLHGEGEGWFSVTKGAPESVLPRCTPARTAAGEAAVAPAEALRIAAAMAAQGMRVLAVARALLARHAGRRRCRRGRGRARPARTRRPQRPAARRSPGRGRRTAAAPASRR